MPVDGYLFIFKEKASRHVYNPQIPEATCFFYLYFNGLPGNSARHHHPLSQKSTVFDTRPRPPIPLYPAFPVLKPVLKIKVSIIASSPFYETFSLVKIGYASTTPAHIQDVSFKYDAPERKQQKFSLSFHLALIT
ncbi:MAG: hypothetical protein H6558_15470 [Lewinellaceae bacterium]|nr:hypothetical protein [Lewinellaceae bacterium]